VEWHLFFLTKYRKINRFIQLPNRQKKITFLVFLLVSAFLILSYKALEKEKNVFSVFENVLSLCYYDLSQVV